MKILIILPHQLFDIKYFPENFEKVIVYEHPQYFTKYNFNKKKLILHRVSMKKYFQYLKKNKIKVSYLEFNKKLLLVKKNEYHMFDPIDKITLASKVNLIESPNFILNKVLYTEYQKKTKSYIFNNFYKWAKKKVDIIPDIKSHDKDNRLKLPKKINIPDEPKSKNNEKEVKNAIKYIDKNFNKNYGNVDNFNLPTTHKEAIALLDNFIKIKFNNFGKYEDAISKEHNIIFHSYLSSSINIGLLNPSEIFEIILKYKSKIPMNSFEGYVRQLFWREYQRYCHIYVDFKKENYFNFKNRLDKKWYNGSIGIEIIDNTIIKAFETGYLHHIERLMVMGNFMVLNEIKPYDGFKWFMEFSIDSYEWVMYQNVYDMVFFVTGGKTMRRPYISSSNYILKMSDYKKGKWCNKWNALYNNFLKKYKNKLWKFRYYFRGLKNV